MSFYSLKLLQQEENLKQHIELIIFISDINKTINNGIEFSKILYFILFIAIKRINLWGTKITQSTNNNIIDYGLFSKFLKILFIE